MDTNELLSEGLEKLIHPMEKEIREQNKIISAQKEQIQHLKRQVALLEAQKKKLKDAGNLLSEKCRDLENICIRQQKLLEEFRGIFSGLPPEP